MTGSSLDVLAQALADRYLVLEELGRGSSATVYLAQDLRHDRRVALKVLHSALGAALGVERFQREIRTQARLHHPHILPLFDSGAAAGRLYYTMPYIESGSLRDRLDRQGPLSVEAATQLVREVASALSYAHVLGVIHRDLKPENILISVSGHALLSDFGIASALNSAGAGGGSGRLTETGVMLGTPAYMSPEQSGGDEELDARSDVYSLGTVAYETLTGTVPFTGPNARTIVAQRLTQEAPSIRLLRPEVPEPVVAAVARALARAPDDRYDTAEAFAAALAATGAVPSAVPSAATTVATAGSGPPKPGARGRRLALAGVAAVVLAGGGALLARALPWPADRPTSTASERRTIAVLPFKNLGSPEDQYFADGLTEEITSRLAGLSGLAVASRTSADQYRETTKSLKDIGGELGVEYVLEGSVRWERPAGGGPGRLRVTPQLIAVKDDSHLWASSYDAELGEAFQLQSKIAEQVTTQLDVALRAPDRASLAVTGTGNSDAYDYYLRGLDYVGRSNTHADLDNAAKLLEAAVAADPGFAQAQARLGRVHAQIYWHYYDRSEARLRLAKRAVDAAVALAPNLPETRAALGYYYYWGMLDYQRALQEFEIARRQQPGNSDLLQAIAYVERRRGRWEESLARFIEALRYDPRSGVRNFEAGDNYFSLHMYPEAEHYLDRAITLSPDWNNPYIYKAWLYVSWKGDLAAARAVLRQGLSRIEAGRFAPGLQTGDRISASLVTADSSFAPMLDGLTLATYTGDSARYHLLKAEAARFRGNAAAERAQGDSSRVILEARLRVRPDDEKMLVALGLAYVHLGRYADAIRAGRRAAERLTVESDAVSGPFVQSNLAIIYMAAGQYDRAVDLLARLLDIPFWITPAALRADPIWAPLRTHPRFRALLTRTPS
jgi:serine/threonine protein kinase/tetratricopeptide (TPR) repeat protein